MKIQDTPLLGDLSGPATILDQHEARISGSGVTDVDAATRSFFSNAPDWLERVMTVRNSVVRRLGFTVGTKERGALPDHFEIGQRFGAFSILERSDEEIVMGGTDKRLALEISIWVPPGQGVLRVTTRANSVDKVGRAYLALIKPGHGLIAPLMTRRAARGEG